MTRYFSWFGLPGALVLTSLMSLLSLILALTVGGTDRWICFAAMLLSTVGDVFLMELEGISRRFPNYFVIGAGFFMVAHLVYAGAFVLLHRQYGYAFGSAGFFTALGIAAITLIIFTILMFRAGRVNTYNVALMLGYVAIISVNMACVFSFAFHGAANGEYWRLISAVGVVSFFLSDCFIGLGMLGGISGFGKYIWWFYPIGQILLLIGA